MGALSSRVLRPAGRTEQPEPTPGAGGAARRSDAGEDAAHSFCYCPGGRKRKRSSGTFCYCHPDSETEEDEDEGDEQQRLLNTPRRYRAPRTWGSLTPVPLTGECGAAARGGSGREVGVCRHTWVSAAADNRRQT